MAQPNVFSVDVEDYFHVEAFSDVVDRATWETYACRVEANTQRVLDLLDECGVQGTFFILGWVAERYPHLVREIVRRGHEPACHSYWHRLIYKLDRAEFAADTRRAKEVIEQAAGEPVFGYRAPSYSITMQSLWALEVLAEAAVSRDHSQRSNRRIPDHNVSDDRSAEPSRGRRGVSQDLAVLVHEARVSTGEG
jgi:polysaccharide deacetylase family protein (PEP-CTERM system associated)